MLFGTLKELISSLEGVVSVDRSGFKLLDKEKVRSEVIDRLVYNVMLSAEKDIKDACCWIIRQLAYQLNIFPASIQGLYEARGRGEYKGITVPAVNLRGLTFDLARALIRAGEKNNSQSYIFEIAKSEIGYTKQSPSEYASVILASAIKEDYQGPVFIQADHVQIKEKNFRENQDEEINSAKRLIEEEINAGFYNIDIDSSTLVNLDEKEISQQQRLNYEVAAELTSFIREKEPEGITISVGGEIGEVGGKNSTPEELRAFMDGYLKLLRESNPALKGISKISVQTGTSHGGVVLPDGSVAEVEVDFDTLERLSKIAQDEYKLAGAVQHGASTLPDEAFGKFPETQTAEIHLATGFQNMVYESKHFPKNLRDEVYNYLKTELNNERKEGETLDQFIYKTRKKAFGPFKKKLINLPINTKDAISSEVEDQFSFLFKKLNAGNTKELINKYIEEKKIKIGMPQALKELI
jgi:fructose/tagatose bisphosphate aldolase